MASANETLDRLIAGLRNITFEKVESVLLEIIPDTGERVRWTDINGKVYEEQARIPARRQIVVGPIIRKNIDTVGNLLSQMFASDGGNLAGRVLLIADPIYVEALAEVYTALHPSTVPEGVDALDLFPVEEMIKAVVPFLVLPLLEVLRSPVLQKLATKLLAGLAGVLEDPSISPKTSSGSSLEA